MNTLKLFSPSFRRKTVVFLFSLIIATTFAGCSITNTIDGLLATDSRKVKLLNERLAKFHRSVYWGSINEAAQFVAVDKQDEFYRDLKTALDKQRFVGIDVENVSYGESDGKATVDVLIRYYQVPSYLVQSRRERETWEFSRVAGAWIYQNREIVEEMGVEETTSSSAGGMRGRL